jgi:hypothetical protein
MMLALSLLGVITILEVLVWLRPLWSARHTLSIVTVLGLSAVNCLLIANEFHVWAMLIAIISIYRIINLLRIIQDRTDAKYLRRVGGRSCLVLVMLQCLVLLLGLANHIANLPTWTWLYFAAIPQLLIAVIFVVATRRNLRTTRPALASATIADRDLPTLTVAIPARNETDELESCLQSIVGSDYPKLEILVLDDCSQNKRTPEIMRQFAHDGVRFIAGNPPPAEWLAKNYAYYQLAEDANGELLLFCGVDTRFERQTLRILVEILLEKQKTMLSVIPANKLPARWTMESLMVQPGRYAWELALPRRWLNRPPVLSTCWLISSKALAAAGGLPAVRRKNSVESYFSRQTALHSDGYSFIQSTPQVGLRSEKSFFDQRATVIRTRYPQLHRRPELAFLLSSTELYLPFAILYDVGLLNYSMWQYEFGEIIWKGRNVCLPVMRAIPSLPKLK